MPPRPPDEYMWINGVERLEMYEPGGLHPVMIGDVLHNRYRVVDKLGYGGYSTIWLAHDSRLDRYVAIKVAVPSSKCSSREPEILRRLSSAEPTAPTVSLAAVATKAIPTILDEFKVNGPNGVHPCYVTVPAQGSVQEAKFSRLFPIKVARTIAARLILAIDFCHSQGFVHGDIHLRNVLIKLPSTLDRLSIDQFRDKYKEPELLPVRRVDGRPLPPNVPPQAVVPLILGKMAQDFTLDDARAIILSDFGEAFAPATEQRLGKDSHIPLTKRPPEALFEPDTPLSFPSDIWSLGHAIWDILGMQPILCDMELQDEIVAQQIDVLGFQNFPARWRKLWERPRTGGEELHRNIPRRPTHDRQTLPSLEEAFEEAVLQWRRKRQAAGVFGDEETKAILDLMRGMLEFSPEKRWTSHEILASEWIVKWALPASEDVDP